MNDLLFIFLHISTIFVLLLLACIIKIRQKGQLQLVFLKNAADSCFFSKQSILLAAGVSIPLVTNILIILKLIEIPMYITAIASSLAIIFLAVAIYRYHFLSIAPVALRTIVDKITDGFVVVNEENNIIDYNLTMERKFQPVAPISRNADIRQVFRDTCLMEDEDSIVSFIDTARASNTPVTFEKHVRKGGFDQHFSIEIMPMMSNKNFMGAIILFRDITENVKHLAQIEEKHAIIMEQERLASLGQLIGGISHNLKTPIMSISGAVEGLKDLVTEYEQSIGDPAITTDDHLEIASEMHSWLNRIPPHCAYMTDIIDTVKGQAMGFSNTTTVSFTIHELLKRIELLMKYELARYSCTLNTVINVSPETELHGDINSLVQVFDNIIINAIQAYEGKKGVIDFLVEEIADTMLFTVKDYGTGIPANVKEKLLKEMVTTKGTAGTGLGLYMSFSIIKARFQGKMWFRSAEGEGTTFYIQLPLKKGSD